MIESHYLTPFSSVSQQVIFTGDEWKTVQGVLDGDFEIGKNDVVD